MSKPEPPVMSPEEAVADIFALDDAPITCGGASDFIAELVKRGYQIAPLPAPPVIAEKQTP
jgi:hypothetical protein